MSDKSDYVILRANRSQRRPRRQYSDMDPFMVHDVIRAENDALLEEFNKYLKDKEAKEKADKDKKKKIWQQSISIPVATITLMLLSPLVGAIMMMIYEYLGRTFLLYLKAIAN